MTDKSYSDSTAVLWQGFRHGWQYNHRANRIGSFVEHKRARDGLWQARVVHAAASGLGPDQARFTTYYTRIKADRVSFQAGCCELLISTVEENLVAINASISVKLAPELADKKVRTVVLNGFDLHAVGDADKLITLVLEVTDPTETDGPSVEFKIKGGFRVDCSSPECDKIIETLRDECEHSWPNSLECLYEHLEDKYKRLPPQKAEYREEDLWVCDDAHFKNPNHDQVLVPDVVPPLDEVVFYRLFVHYLVVAGEGEHLYVEHRDLAPPEKEYQWDDSTELSIEDEDVKERRVEFEGKEGYAGGVHAFKKVAMSFYREPSKRGFIKWWRSAKAMHLLDWHIAITGGATLKTGKPSAIVDLFFKNWRRWMTGSSPPYSFLAYRDAGYAQFDCRLTLLQFKKYDILAPGTFEDEIRWPSRRLISRDAHGKIKFFAPIPSTDDRASKFERVPLET